VDHLKSENSSAKDYVDELIVNSGDSKIVRIPTATLRELFIPGFSTSQDETSSSETSQARVLAPLVLS